MMKSKLKWMLEKLAEELVSVKIHIITLATILLYQHRIGETVWSSVTISIGLGRVVIESIAAYSRGNSAPQAPVESDI